MAIGLVQDASLMEKVARMAMAMTIHHAEAAALGLSLSVKECFDQYSTPTFHTSIPPQHFTRQDGKSTPQSRRPALTSPTFLAVSLPPRILH
jgi:hypothetical protein